MQIRGIEVDVDIVEELNHFTWRNERIKGNEWVCCSPFRDERRPSFSINLDSGLWIDFGSDDEHWKKGSFPRLLAWLENISDEEAENMLLEAYGIILDDVEDLILSIDISDDPQPKTFSRDELKPYLFRNRSYLAGRGISDDIQKQFVIGYWKEKKAVAFFWRDAFSGKVINVKFRSVQGKQFFYINGGQQIKNHMYGLYDVIQAKQKEMIVVESETDALYLWSNGYAAAALGGSYLSADQKALLIRSGVESIIIATDNDAAGNRVRESIKKELGGLIDLKDLKLPDHAKDINDLDPGELKEVVDQVQPVEYSFLT